MIRTTRKTRIPRFSSPEVSPGACPGRSRRGRSDGFSGISKYLIHLVVLVCGFSILSGNSTAAELERIEGAPQAPLLKLDDVYGKPHDLIDYRGRVVLVNFWATWCPPCIQEMPSMQRLKDLLSRQPFTILTVNMGETEQEALAFLERWQLNLDVLMDKEGKTIEDWRVYVFPTSFIVGAKGKNRYGLRGPIEWDSADTVQQIKELLP